MQGLGGIPPVRGKIIRPLLEVSRAEIDGYIERHHISYVEDESNLDAAYTRNRLRLEVLPLLEELAPGAAGRIASTAELLREENEHIQREVEELLPEAAYDSISLSVPVLEKQDEVLRRRLVRTMGQRLGITLTRAQTEAVLALGSGGFLDLPQGLCAVRKARQLILRKPPPQFLPLALHPGEQVWGSWKVTLERGEGPVEERPGRVVLRDPGGTLSIAAWDGRGRFRVENGSRTIKRLFSDRKILIEQRAEHPMVLADGRAVAVIGVAVDWMYRPRGGEPWAAVTLRRLVEET